MTPEHRREPRRQANGAVRVWSAHPERLEIRGLLIDISDSGFRMSHENRTLQTGQTVEFSHIETAGKAKVIWNRIVGARVETGFLVLA
jgi:hypothetical protein